MFLSTPLTVTLMVVCEQFQGARWVAILLSSNGDPEGADAAAADPGPPAVVDRGAKKPRRAALTQA
jgi:hypothetical protein